MTHLECCEKIGAAKTNRWRLVNKEKIIFRTSGQHSPEHVSVRRKIQELAVEIGELENKLKDLQ